LPVEGSIQHYTGRLCRKDGGEIVVEANVWVVKDLDGIIGMVDLALDLPLTTERREYLNVVKGAAASLLRLLDDILDFGKFEARKLALEPLGFQLRENLGSTTKTLAVRAHTKALELACRIVPSVPDPLVGDLARLLQALVNLV
jgi:two-component system sensor histidine kinase/response regulator